MTPQEASALLVYARQHDHLVVDTDAQAHTWATHLENVPIEAGRLIVSDYYGRHSEPDRRKPVDASVIRKLYFSKLREATAKESAGKYARGEIEPPERKGPPPHVKAKLDAFKAKHAKK